MIKSLFLHFLQSGGVAQAPTLALGMCLVAFACTLILVFSKPRCELARTRELPLHDE